MILVAATGGCEATRQADEIRADRSGQKLTTGLVQREIRKGMASAEVAEKLGSPNIVTTDEQGREVWVYERFAREVTSSDAGFFVVLFGTGHKSAAVSQRSLTVIIKFDQEGRVRDHAYHSASF
jgi:outer membrane protein assembly factor BamE (lipoprotein component of BamABCDE complex)